MHVQLPVPGKGGAARKARDGADLPADLLAIFFLAAFFFANFFLSGFADFAMI